jgi:arylsulfatase A-like enzyme
MRALDRQVSRRGLLSGAAAATLLGAAGTAAAAGRRDDRPNVVVILADDLGYGALGAYGQQVLSTPNLDRLAREGIAFTDAHSGAPICAPSRCALLTGQHTGHTTVRENSFTVTGIPPSLKPSDTTWAKALNDVGYATGAFGKWGFGPDHCYESVPQGFARGNPGGPDGSLLQDLGHESHPLQKGFDEFLGLVTHDQATDGYFPNYIWDGNRRRVLRENVNNGQKTYAPDLSVHRALDFMRRHRSRPFAVYLAPQLVHWPNLIPSTSPYDDKPWTTELKRYAAMYTRLDSYVGMVRSQLESLGLTHNTLLLFTSDNGSTVERVATGSGESSMYHRPSESYLGDKLWNIQGGLRAEKHALYEGGIRVPFIAWGPGIVRTSGKGQVADRAFSSWDIFPTLTELAGARNPRGLDGHSLLGWITGHSSRPERPLYWERQQVDMVFDVSPPGFAQAARIAYWKAVRYTVAGQDPHTPDARWEFELYDLAADRGETRDVAALHPDVRAHMEHYMNASHVDPT